MEEYYVYTKEGLYKTFNTYYNLLLFVRNGNWQRFGNTLVDKRHVTINVKDTWFFKGNLFLMGPTELRTVEFIAKDTKGNVLNCKKLENDAYYADKFRNMVPEYCWNFRNWGSTHTNYPGFRKGPVPYTGSRMRCRYSCCRYMKTTQELRLNQAYKEFVRAKRRNIPTAYDDKVRSDRRNRSWKHQKKRKQWM